MSASLAPKTLTQYKQVLELWVLPKLGDVKVSRLDGGAIKALLAAQRTQGLSKNTVRSSGRP